MLCQITLRHHPKNGGVTGAKVNIFFNYELKIKNEKDLSPVPSPQDRGDVETWRATSLLKFADFIYSGTR